MFEPHEFTEVATAVPATTRVVPATLLVDFEEASRNAAADPQRADSPTRDPKFLRRLYHQFTDALPYLQEATVVIRTSGLDLAGVAEALLSRVAPQ